MCVVAPEYIAPVKYCRPTVTNVINICTFCDYLGVLTCHKKQLLVEQRNNVKSNMCRADLRQSERLIFLVQVTSQSTRTPQTQFVWRGTSRSSWPSFAPTAASCVTWRDTSTTAPITRTKTPECTTWRWTGWSRRPLTVTPSAPSPSTRTGWFWRGVGG